MRVGVLGGTFDPVHRGHLAVARAAIRRLRLDLLLVVPARRSPLKGARPAAARHRLAMLRLAFRGMKGVRISPMELRRPAPSYTVDTLRALKRRWPSAALFLLMGADAYRDLGKWHRPGEIRRLATVAVFPRPGVRPSRDPSVRIRMVPVKAVATDLRTATRSPSGAIPSVWTYVRHHRLYALRKEGAAS